MPVIAGRNVNNNDLGVMGGGAALLVFSFFTWFSSPIGNNGLSGWNSGIFSFLAILLGVAAGVLVALRVFADVSLPRLQWGWSFIVFAASAAAAVLILLKVLIGYDTLIGDADRSLGLYLSFLAALVETAFAYFAFKLSGETLPGGRRI
jgi:hypothetical protein